MSTLNAPPTVLSPAVWGQDPNEIDRIRALIVDDSALLRRGLAEALSTEESMEIVGEASDGNEAVELAKALEPHLILMDLNMPNCDGVEATRRIQREAPGIDVVIITVSDTDTDLIEALKAGARGYLLKNESKEQIVQTAHHAVHGGTLVSRSMAIKLLSNS